MSIQKFLYRIKKKLLKNRKTFSCSVCGMHKVQMLPLSPSFIQAYKDHDFIFPIEQFETLNIKNYSCSNCGATDRSRLIALFVGNHLEKRNPKNFKFLDIAPANNLGNFLKNKLTQGSYRTADLFMENVDDKIDMQNMHQYQDNSWDAILCSHVLEHVKDDSKALKEMFRVLDKNGIAILLAPIVLNIDKSSEAVKGKNYTEAERWKFFGQDDHERIYSKQDFIERIENAGFKLHQLDNDHFGNDTFKKYGITKKSVLYIGEKI